MKKLILAVVLLAMLGLLVTMPAVAQEDQCVHGGATIADLRACVEHAYQEGHITNRGVYRTLLAQLDAAQAAYDRGQTAVAVSLLQAFIYTVETQAGLTIDEVHAEHIVSHAQAVVAALEQ